MIRQSANRFLWLPTINSTDECVFSALSAVPFGALTASDRGEYRQAAVVVAEALRAFRRIRYKLAALFISSQGETMDPRVAPQMYCDADTVRRFIAEYLGIDVKQVTDEAHLIDDLGLDWLDQLELMILIEEQFVGVDFFANTPAGQIELVGDLIRHIEHNATLARRPAA